ncbi:DUF3465 domain-containing protein [Moritella sp. JT01]
MLIFPPRINSISKGDSVQFYGEYKWTNKRGVVDWTTKIQMTIFRVYHL